MKKIVLSIGVIIHMVNITLAQEKKITSLSDSAHRSELKELVVTGQYRPQSVKNSVYQVRIISKERIQQLAASKLQDVLMNELNIRFSQDLATGGSDITMMGLSGQNVKILIDGVPMIGRQGTSNEININQVDVNTIERIEIIEGPLSVVYGADALAGVINIITKKPISHKISITARLQEETAGKEYGWKQGIHNQYAGLRYNYKNWQVGGGIGRNMFNGWKGDTTGRELIWHKKDQLLANALFGYRTNRLNVYYRFDGLDEIITNPANFTGNQPANDQEYLSKRVMQQIQSAYTVNGKLSANTAIAHTHFSRQLYSTLFYPNGDVRVSTAPGAHSTNVFSGLTYRATVIYKPAAYITIQSGIDINSETGDGERVKDGKQKITDYALFFTSEITPIKRINIRPGIRIIKNSVYDAPPFIPSINTKCILSKNIDLRLAYARGFRAPSLRELYFDFRDASHDILGNENLKAEQSNSYTGSITWKLVQTPAINLSAILSGFYNDVDNMISYVQSTTDPRVTTYANIDTYKTKGVAVNNTLTYKSITASLGYSLVSFYNQFTNANKSLPSFTNSSEINSTASYTVKKPGLTLNLYYKYTGKRPYFQEAIQNGQMVIIPVATEGYHWIDFTMNKSCGRYIQVNAGVRNIADITTINDTATGTGIHSSGGARPIGYGRSFFAGLVFNWAK